MWIGGPKGLTCRGLTKGSLQLGAVCFAVGCSEYVTLHAKQSSNAGSITAANNYLFVIIT